MFTTDLVPFGMPSSLNGLLNKSSLVVDATVQEVLPARIMSSRRLETDIKIKINAVLKGPRITGPVVVRQFGGSIGKYTEYTTQYDLMKVGEHYIVFLSVDDRPGIPPIAGARRYAPIGEWHGLFQVLPDNTLSLPEATPDAIRQRYQKAPLDQLMKDIQQASR
ncbi:MAG TPA: hypothetical protein VG675_24290 [Bryobacteraceae bacterium]|nr:hypothetical protein [Bryobacteraceae bacterium]